MPLKRKILNCFQDLIRSLSRTVILELCSTQVIYKKKFLELLKIVINRFYIADPVNGFNAVVETRPQAVVPVAPVAHARILG